MPVKNRIAEMQDEIAAWRRTAGIRTRS